jgi:hypothetical protein
MLLAIAPLNLIEAHPGLATYAREPDVARLPSGVTLYLNLFLGPLARFIGTAAVMREQDHATYVVTELAYPPFAYAMVFSEPEEAPGSCRLRHHGLCARADRPAGERRDAHAVRVRAHALPAGLPQRCRDPRRLDGESERRESLASHCFRRAGRASRCDSTGDVCADPLAARVAGQAASCWGGSSRSSRSSGRNWSKPQQPVRHLSQETGMPTSKSGPSASTRSPSNSLRSLTPIVYPLPPLLPSEGKSSRVDGHQD